MHAMTEKKGRSGTIGVKVILAGDEEFPRALVRTALQEVLEAEMTEGLGDEKRERATGRQGYRPGYFGRTLITRVFGGRYLSRIWLDRRLNKATIFCCTCGSSNRRKNICLRAWCCSAFLISSLVSVRSAIAR
jgi:hypothetical protein